MDEFKSYWTLCLRRRSAEWPLTAADAVRSLAARIQEIADLPELEGAEAERARAALEVPGSAGRSGEWSAEPGCPLKASEMPGELLGVPVQTDVLYSDEGGILRAHLELDFRGAVFVRKASGIRRFIEAAFPVQPPLMRTRTTEERDAVQELRVFPGDEPPRSADPVFSPLGRDWTFAGQWDPEATDEWRPGLGFRADFVPACRRADGKDHMYDASSEAAGRPYLLEWLLSRRDRERFPSKFDLLYAAGELEGGKPVRGIALPKEPADRRRERSENE